MRSVTGPALFALVVPYALLLACAPDPAVVWQREMRAAAFFQVRNDSTEAERRLLLALEASSQLGVADTRYTRALDSLATLYETEARPADGAALFERTLPKLEGAFGSNDPRLAPHLEQWATFSYQLARFDAAEGQLRRALALRTTSALEDPRGEAMGHHRLALVHQARGKWAPAEAEHRRALGGLEGFTSDDDIDLARIRTVFAGLLVEHRRFSEAEPLIERGLPALQNRLQGPVPILVQGLAYRAVVRLESGAETAAILDVAHLELLYDRASVGTRSAVQKNLLLVAETCEGTGQLPHAVELYERLANFAREYHGPMSLEAGTMVHRLGRVLVAQGRYDPAEDMLLRAMVAFENAKQPRPAALAAVLDTWARLHEAEGRLQEAEAFRARAARLRGRL